MRILAPAIIAMTLIGCAKGQVSQTVLVDVLAQPMCGLAAAVHDDGGPKSMTAARRVIAIYDAGVLDKRASRC